MQLYKLANTINIPFFLAILVHFSHDKSPAHFDYKPENLKINVFFYNSNSY